jgi:hypothetical protein
LDALASTPRFAGSADEAAARRLCRDELVRSGFACSEIPFEFSEWPGRWGPIHVAAAQAVTIILVSRTELSMGPLAALIVGAIVVTVLLLLLGDAKRRWTSDFRFMRAKSVNLEAKRGEPKLWLVAHLDSKSQTIPMLFRIAGSLAQALVALVALLMLLLALAGALQDAKVWTWIQVAAVVAATPTLICWVRNDSNGALDNASGVAAVLLAASDLQQTPDLGVLLTSGEELGLAGARDWARGLARDVTVLNCDTFDDVGKWRCMHTGRTPQRLTAAVETSASALGLQLSTGRLIPGILADSIAFSDLGIAAVTLSRGTLSTLARIHTRRDNSPLLTGKGVANGARLLSQIARQLA